MLAALGCQELIVTNAAGALNPCFRPGEIMVIDDHVSLPSLAGLSPLVGVAPTGGTPRFVDLSGAYSRRLAALADVAAEANGQSVRHGVYVMVGGPNFETPAEVRFLQHLGDAVGMSTVPEVIVARQLGLEVLGVSILSNLAAGLPGALLEHEDVLRVVGQTAPVVGQLIQSVLRRIGA
jgi:purine-nucleoside phosphorylase